MDRRQDAEGDAVRVRVGSVALELPASIAKKTEQGVDSGAAVFEGGGLMVLVDEGPFASSLEFDAGRPGYREEVRAVGGGTGRVVSYRDPDGGSYTIAVHVSEPRRVTVVVRAEEAVPERVPLRIIESVRIVD